MIYDCSEKLSTLLNSQKVLQTETGYDRDWRGILVLSGLGQSERNLITQSRDQTAKLLELWRKSNRDNNNVVTLSRFRECLETIDRYDVIDDTFELLGKFFMLANLISGSDETIEVTMS
jgi:Death domain